MVSIKCPACRNTLLETAHEGEEYLVTRFNMLHIVGEKRRVRCRRCGNWVWVPRSLF